MRFVRWRQLDTMETAERVREECRRIMGTLGPVRTVYVDPIGIGAGVLDRLAQILPTLLREPIPMPRRLGRAGDRPPPTTHTAPTAEGFDAGKRAGRPDRFVNARAQGYWHLRRMLEEGRLALPPSPELDEELLATRVRYTTDGKVQIAGKDDLRSRLGRSPDTADALVISLAGELEDDRLAMWVA